MSGSSATAEPISRCPSATGPTKTSCGNGIPSDSSAQGPAVGRRQASTSSFPTGWADTTASFRHRPDVRVLMMAACLCVAAARADAQSQDAADVETRLRFIQQSLDASERRIDWWQNGWLAAYT